MPKPTVVFKSSVSRRQAAETVDQAERQLQADHHQAVEDAHQPAVEAATATPEAPSGKQLRLDAHALQAAFLSGNLGKPVIVFTLNNIRLTGRLRQFDQYCLLLEGPNGLNSLVFKHAITTIAPASDAHREQRQPESGGTYP